MSSKWEIEPEKADRKVFKIMLLLKEIQTKHKS